MQQKKINSRFDNYERLEQFPLIFNYHVDALTKADFELQIVNRNIQIDLNKYQNLMNYDSVLEVKLVNVYGDTILIAPATNATPYRSQAAKAIENHFGLMFIETDQLCSEIITPRVEANVTNEKLKDSDNQNKAIQTGVFATVGIQEGSEAKQNTVWSLNWAYPLYLKQSQLNLKLDFYQSFPQGSTNPIDVSKGTQKYPNLYPFAFDNFQLMSLVFEIAILNNKKT